eukprot:scaffold7123_cov119-Isochrysis_galbana.AAC.14
MPFSSGRKVKSSCVACPAPRTPSDGITANGSGTESEKRPSFAPVLRSKNASCAVTRTGCSPKSTASGNSKHGRGPRARRDTRNFSRSVTHARSQA